jgi:mannosylglycoprotein endo-beta-mannosidase
MVSQDCEKAIGYAEILNCATGTWPIKYLGVPVSSSKLHVRDWVPVDEKMLGRLDGWKGSALSLGGRLILLNSSLSSIPTYYMSMHLLPQTILKRMDRTRKKFFWQGGGEKKKYHLVKWLKITSPKSKGGLGVKDLRKMNLSLLCKWWWKLEFEEGMWQEIVRKKYKIFQGISGLQRKPRNSSAWNDLLKVKQLYVKGRIMILGNGKRIDFWEDAWCGMVALKDKFRGLYDICSDQKVSVEEMAQRGWRLTFRRWLNESQQTQLRQLRDMLFTCALSNEKDRVKWVWEKSGAFSVKSMYNHLFRSERNDPKKALWKAKIPMKVKIFMWLVDANAILTKDILSRKNWQGDKRCFFCNVFESIEHLFFDCYMSRYIWSLVAHIMGAVCRPSSFEQFWVWVDRYMHNYKKVHMVGLSAICWAVWKSRNAIHFEKKAIRSPTEIICLASSLLIYWAGLQKDESTKQALEAGAEAMKETALHFHPSQDAGAVDNGVLLLQQ